MRLTEWFEASVPNQVGVYEVNSIYGSRAFSYWNGLCFAYHTWTDCNGGSEERAVDDAYKNRDQTTELRPTKWRGLAENPNKKEDK